MIYEYECDRCGGVHEIEKPFSEYERAETCSDCNSPMHRLVTAVNFSGEKVEDAYFHPSLGQVVSGDKEAALIAKSRGMECIGNENPHKHLKPQKADYMDEKSWQV